MEDGHGVDVWLDGYCELAYGQKGVDGGSKWSAGTRETEVGLDGLCEGGLGQQE